MLQQVNTASKLAAGAGLVVKFARLTNDKRVLVKLSTTVLSRVVKVRVN